MLTKVRNILQPLQIATCRYTTHPTSSEIKLSALKELDKGFGPFYEGNYHNTLAYCDLALKKDPDCALAYSLKADCLRHSEHYTEAIRQYDLALQKCNSQLVTACLGKAACFRLLGQYEKAQEQYELALQNITHSQFSKAAIENLMKQSTHEMLNALVNDNQENNKIPEKNNTNIACTTTIFSSMDILREEKSSPIDKNAETDELTKVNPKNSLI